MDNKVCSYSIVILAILLLVPHHGSAQSMAELEAYFSSIRRSSAVRKKYGKGSPEAEAASADALRRGDSVLTQANAELANIRRRRAIKRARTEFEIQANFQNKVERETNNGRVNWSSKPTTKWEANDRVLGNLGTFRIDSNGLGVWSPLPDTGSGVPSYQPFPHPSYSENYHQNTTQQPPDLTRSSRQPSSGYTSYSAPQPSVPSYQNQARGTATGGKNSSVAVENLTEGWSITVNPISPYAALTAAHVLGNGTNGGMRYKGVRSSACVLPDALEGVDITNENNIPFQWDLAVIIFPKPVFSSYAPLGKAEPGDSVTAVVANWGGRQIPLTVDGINGETPNSDIGPHYNIKTSQLDSGSSGSGVYSQKGELVGVQSGVSRNRGMAAVYAVLSNHGWDLLEKAKRSHSSAMAGITYGADNVQRAEQSHRASTAQPNRSSGQGGTHYTSYQPSHYTPPPQPLNTSWDPTTGSPTVWETGGGSLEKNRRSLTLKIHSVYMEPSGPGQVSSARLVTIKRIQPNRIYLVINETDRQFSFHASRTKNGRVVLDVRQLKEGSVFQESHLYVGGSPHRMYRLPAQVSNSADGIELMLVSQSTPLHLAM